MLYQYSMSLLHNKIYLEKSSYLFFRWFRVGVGLTFEVAKVKRVLGLTRFRDYEKYIIIFGYFKWFCVFCPCCIIAFSSSNS